MNSRHEWTVLTETMCFYGVAHFEDGNFAARITVSTSFVPVGAVTGV
jgi:hypothetical protein